MLSFPTASRKRRGLCARGLLAPFFARGADIVVAAPGGAVAGGSGGTLAEVAVVEFKLPLHRGDDEAAPFTPFVLVARGLAFVCGDAVPPGARARGDADAGGAIAATPARGEGATEEASEVVTSVEGI